MRTLAFSLLITSVVACDGVSGREARGRLDLSSTSHRVDSLVTVDDLGRRTSVELEPDGAFEISLDEGRQYALGFSDSESQRRGVLAQLVLRGSLGWQSKLHIAPGPVLEFGVIRPVPREVELEIELEHPAVESGDDNGRHHRDCRSLGDDGEIAVMPSFLVVGELEGLDDDSSSGGLDDGQLRDQDGDLCPDAFDDDRDGDGLCDDSSEDGGEPDAGDAGDAGEDDSNGRADLPYDIRPRVGDTVQLSEVFLLKGPAPAEILSVEMEAPAWRFGELMSDAPFVVTEADCSHEGNRGVGRDRIYVAWRNADGTRELDHLDLRYCKE